MFKPHKYFLIVQPMDKPDSVNVKIITACNIQEILNKMGRNAELKLLHYFREDVLNSKDENHAYQISSDIHQQHVEEAAEFLDIDWEEECSNPLVEELTVEVIGAS